MVVYGAEVTDICNKKECHVSLYYSFGFICAGGGFAAMAGIISLVDLYMGDGGAEFERQLLIDNAASLSVNTAKV